MEAEGTLGSSPTPDATSTAAYDPSKDPKRKAKSKDPGWKYGYWPDLTDKSIVKCNLCKKDLHQGIKRLKQHLAGGYGDVAKCTKTTPAIAAEMNAAIMRNRKKKVTEILDDEEEEDNDQGEHVEELNEQTHSGARPQSTTPKFTPSSGTATKRKKVVHQPQARGPMDAHVSRTPEQVVADRHNKSLQQTTIERSIRSPEEKKRVDNHIADWFYQCGIPFNAAKSPSFEVMVESIAQYGRGYRPPSYHELRVPLLKSATEKIAEMKKTHEEHWKQYGCTLMSDGWTDKRGRHLINFLVNCIEGTFFMGSIDASRHIQDANMLFQLLDSKVEEIGEDNVVQIVTDNAANYKAAGRLLMEKRTKLYWTPCAAHCLDLMLEDIGNLSPYKGVIARARNITKFIYRHTRLLDAMRTRTGGNDLVRAGVTRFATSFLTLHSLLKHKDALKHLFISDDWKLSNLSTTEAGRRVAETVFATTFWNGVDDCFRALKPLINVLRIVDGDEKPAMPEVYAAMEMAKKTIKGNFGDKERLWKRVIQIVEKRWECQMERPLYAAALFLNPGKFFQYKETDDEQARMISTLQEGFYAVITRLVPDLAMQDKIIAQAELYREVRSIFAADIAIRQRTVLSPSK